MEKGSNGHMTLAVALCLAEAKGVKQRKLASTTHFQAFNLPTLHFPTSNCNENKTGKYKAKIRHEQAQNACFVFLQVVISRFPPFSFNFHANCRCFASHPCLQSLS